MTRRESKTVAKNILQGATGILGFIAFLVVSFGLLALVFGGVAFLSEKLIPFLQVLSIVMFWIVLIVLLPISLFKNTRGITSVCILISSFVFGITAWTVGFSITYQFWGIFWVIFGLCLAGIGVVPLGLLAAAVHSEWGLFWSLFLTVGIAYGFRMLALHLGSKYEAYLTTKLEQANSSNDYESLKATLQHISNGSAEETIKKRISYALIDRAEIEPELKAQLLIKTDERYAD